MSQTAVANAPKLPKKEAELYRQVVNCYETKEYKKGIKIADTVLKKFPTNSEILAMKGLLLNHTGNKEGAYDLVKTGIRNDVRSPVCWHVYGLLYRSDNNYKEAIKCYLNALRIEPNKENIMRDLSFLQIQMRDIPGFVNTRRKILELRPTIRPSWVAFAVANYANHDYELAYEVTVKYFETRNELPEAFEESEFLIFQVLCLENLEKFTDARSRLLEVKDSIIDGLTYHIKLATLSLYAGDFESAFIEFEQLLVEQPENFSFHRALQTALLKIDYPTSKSLLSLKRQLLPCAVLTLNEGNLEELLQFYNNSVQSSFKKSRVFAKIRLFLLQFLPDFSSCFSSGVPNESSLFFAALEQFISKNTNDGFPALGHDILFLATATTSKLDFSRPIRSKKSTSLDAIDLKNHVIIKSTLLIITRLLTQLRSPENSEFTLSKSPQMEFWLLYLQAHLYLKMGRLADAEEAIRQAEEHTPTALDLYSRKSRVFKLQGDFLAASQCMDQNRSLDLQDRFLNNKSTKYLLRNDQLQLASETIAMFTKHDAADVDKTIVDQQCTWFEIESGESAVRLKKYGLALRRFYSIKKHFTDQYDDLFDFHGYCYRKTTLRFYLDTLTNLDAYYANDSYLRTMRKCLGLFGYLLDNPEDIDGLGHLSAADRKKERAKLKKLKLKSETAYDNSNETAESGEKKENSAEKEEEMLLAKDFLQESAVWTNPILANDDLLLAIDEDSLAIIAEFAIRRGRYLHALRAINIALEKNNGTFHPEITLVIVKLAVKMKAKKLGSNVTPLVLTTLRTETARLLGGGESASYLNEYLTRYVQFVAEHPSIVHVLSAVKCVQLVEKNIAVDKVREIVGRENVLDVDQCRGLLYKHLAELVKYLQGQYPTESFVADFTARAATLFPRAKLFQSSASTATAATAATGNDSCDATGYHLLKEGEQEFVKGLGGVDVL